MLGRNGVQDEVEPARILLERVGFVRGEKSSAPSRSASSRFAESDSGR